MAMQEGISLIEDIERKLQAQKVFCFLKGFKKEQNHTVVQLYTENEVMPLRNTELEPTQINPMLQTPPEPDKEKSQFFTPSLSASLEETATSSSSKKQAAQSSPPSKRTLRFGTIDQPITQQSPTKEPISAPSSPQMQTTQSPGKKSKNKGQHAQERAN